MIEFAIDLGWSSDEVWETLNARPGAVVNQDISRGMLTTLLGIYRESGWTIRRENLATAC
jgi:hypothetical protein